MWVEAGLRGTAHRPFGSQGKQECLCHLRQGAPVVLVNYVIGSSECNVRNQERRAIVRESVMLSLALRDCIYFKWWRKMLRVGTSLGVGPNA